jgi:hypothetical protein
MAPRDGFEPPTNGLTGRPTRSQLYLIVINQGLSNRRERQNTLSYTPLRLRGKHSGNKTRRVGAGGNSEPNGESILGPHWGYKGTSPRS